MSDDENAVALVAAITLVTGILFLLLALLKMGWISQFLSKAVITGFLFGAAIEVVIGELPKITGTSVEGSNSWQKLATWVRGLPDTHGTTLLVGLLALALIFGLRRVAPRIPGALVLVITGLVASAAFGLAIQAWPSWAMFPAACHHWRSQSQFVMANLPVIAAAWSDCC